MAKKTSKKPPAAAKAAAAATDNAACKLQPVPDSSDFEAPTGASVTLFTHDHVGMVLIAKAEYAGHQLVPAGQAVSKVTFTALANRNTLKLVLVFSAMAMGQGELRETCGQGSQFIRALFGDEPLQIFRIFGK